MKTLLEHATVVTMNARKEIFYDAHVLIEDSRIASVGGVNSGEADQVIDCRGKIIIPGLVSAHSHLTGLLQRGLWDENSFESWSQKSTATRSYSTLLRKISPCSTARLVWSLSGTA